jgi:dolichol-phosphate mannosyltransferase
MDGRRWENTPDGLSLVIPAYNEVAGIGLALAEADTALARLGRPYEILVVDDGSTDGTADAIRRSQETSNAIRLLRHPRNLGYGAALRTGFESAGHPLIGFTDADRQFDLADLTLLLEQVERHAIVVGYRIDRQDPWRRRFLSWGYNRLVWTLLGTGVRDCDCALKVFRRDAILQLLPESTNFFVNTEMLARARRLNLAVAEVGVRHRPRCFGASKVSLAEVPRTLAILLPFWWAHVTERDRSRPKALRLGVRG